MPFALSGETRLDLFRHTSTFIGLFISVVPLAALGGTAEQPGIDLTVPAHPETPLPPPPAGTKPVAREAREGELGPVSPGESDVALEDRVKAVQRKGFIKRGRLELGLSLPGSINDAFYEKVGGGGKLAYHFAESFALAVRGAYYDQIRTSHVREGNEAFDSQLVNSQLLGQAMLDGIWSPVYGKIAWLGSSIVTFDMYLLAGFGAAWSATSIAPRSEGPHIAADLGLGLRFYPAEWLALEGGVIATFYPDQAVTSVPSTMQKAIMAQVGVSVFFPTTFRYVYP
jgi:outer membrane beta-barrel protein